MSRDRWVALFSRLSLALCAVPSVAAQSILVVDSNLGPGSQFTEIQEAVDAAQPGDRILVRTGSYSAFSVDKPLAIIGEGTPWISAYPQVAIAISGIPAGSDLVVRNVLMRDIGGITVRNCAGRVLLDRVSRWPGGGVSVAVVDCAQVLLGNCTLEDTAVTRSNVTIANSQIQGRRGPGLVVTDSDVTLGSVSLLGAESWFATPAVGVRLSNGRLTITGDATHYIGAGPGPSGPVATFKGSGTVTADPEVELGQPWVDDPRTITLVRPQVPALVARGAGLGGTGSVQLTAEPNDSYFLFVGSPGPAMSFPSLGGTSWLDPANASLYAAGALDETGVAQWTYPVPFAPEWVGYPVGWLAVAGSSVFRLSNNAAHSFGR